MDEDYAFGRPALEAPAEPKRPVIDPKLLVSASSFGIKALDCALADLSTPECVRGYLGEPRLRSWLAGLRRNRPTEAERGDTLIAAAWARVDPASRENDAEDEAPADWRRKAWPIRVVP